MGTTNEERSENSAGVQSTHPDAVQTAVKPSAPAATAGLVRHSGEPDTNAATPSAAMSHSSRRWLLWGGILAGVAAVAYVLIPFVVLSLNTVSTDDAYVNGHVTFIAPRVAGHVANVLVDNNQRVKKGDILVQIDKEPYQIQVDIMKSALATAKAELAMVLAQARGLVAQTRSSRFRLDHAMEEVRNQIELLKSNVAQLKLEEANRVLAEKDYARGQSVVDKGAISRQQFDQYKAALDVAVNRVTSAEQLIQQTRVSLGLPINHKNPLDIPEDLEENFSKVREALGMMYSSLTQLGFAPTSWAATPKQAKEEFFNQLPDKNVDHIYERLIPESPAVKRAEAKVLQANNDLADAELKLRYCDVVSDIDGQVTSRNVNPGNHVQIGQSLLAVRSLTEIWIDANFKETQLVHQRIGQRVRCEVDMYGGRQEFEGRITGFTMGTGTTLALLPPQNATGNFVKIVQRLPVRIELLDYDPEKTPLFIGLSVVPYVYIKEPPTGPHAGEVLQPSTVLPKGSVAP